MGKRYLVTFSMDIDGDGIDSPKDAVRQAIAFLENGEGYVYRALDLDTGRAYRVDSDDWSVKWMSSEDAGSIRFFREQLGEPAIFREE